MVVAESIVEEPPQEVKAIFDHLLTKLEDTDTLKERKALEEEIDNIEEYKTLSLYFVDGESRVSISITGKKTSYKTYTVENYNFVFESKDGIYRKTLSPTESSMARQALQLILLFYNFDVNIKPYVP